MIGVDLGLSRQDTTLGKARYLAAQMPLDARPGTRGWVHRALRLRVAEARRDRDLVAIIVRGRHYLGRWPALAEEWRARKCRPGGLWAAPRLLVAYADPAVGHDGGLYRGAGAAFCGPGAQGRLLFAWALDPALREPLRELGRAAEERRR